MRAADPEHVEDHNRNANRNRGISDVERPEMIRPPIYVDEVNDRPGNDPIDQIACRPADDERQADARDELVVGEARRVHADADERGRGDHGDDDGLERKVNAVEDAEGGAAVRDVRDVHETGHDVDALVERHHRADHGLRQLIKRDDQDRQPDFQAPCSQGRKRLGAPLDHLAGGIAHAAWLPAASASWHRAQSPAHAGSVDTLSTYRQHRSHFTPPARSIVIRNPSSEEGRSSTSDTMKSMGRSRRYRSRSSNWSLDASRITLACSELPMRLFLRSGSISARTCSRTLIRRSQ